MQNVNRVVLVGNLAADPELRTTGSGASVCSFRVAVNSRSKQSGEWADKANFFTVKVFGTFADVCAQHLAKGRGVAIDGRLDHQTWDAKDGSRRSSVEVIAENVQFVGGRDTQQAEQAEQTAAAPVAAGRLDDDIPF